MTMKTTSEYIDEMLLGAAVFAAITITLWVILGDLPTVGYAVWAAPLVSLIKVALNNRARKREGLKENHECQ